MEMSSIQEYVSSAQADIEESPQMGEATTKAALLGDFIELLGWNIPTNTELEYSVKAFGKTFKADYALVLDGRPVAFVEAKGLDTTLTADHREQLSEYLRSEDVDWGILTNGEEYEFYRRRVIDSKVHVEAIEQTTLQQLPNKRNIIEVYCIETMRDEEADNKADRIRKLRESRETLTQDKDELATAVVDALSNSVSETVEPEAEVQAKEMIDRLISHIESEIGMDSTGQGGQRRIANEPDEDSAPVADSHSVEITQSGTVIKRFEDSVQSELMASIVDYFIENHDLIASIQPLPYIPAKKRAIIHDSPRYNEREMAQPRELSQGYYLEVNLSWSQKKRELIRLAEVCNVEMTIKH